MILHPDYLALAALALVITLTATLPLHVVHYRMLKDQVLASSYRTYFRETFWSVLCEVVTGTLIMLLLLIVVYQLFYFGS